LEFLNVIKYITEKYRFSKKFVFLFENVAQSNYFVLNNCIFLYVLLAVKFIFNERNFRLYSPDGSAAPANTNIWE